MRSFKIPGTLWDKKNGKFCVIAHSRIYVTFLFSGRIIVAVILEHEPIDFAPLSGWLWASSAARSCMQSKVAAISSVRRKNEIGGLARNWSLWTKPFMTKKIRSRDWKPTWQRTRRKLRNWNSISRLVCTHHKVYIICIYSSICNVCNTVWT